VLNGEGNVGGALEYCIFMLICRDEIDCRDTSIVSILDSGHGRGKTE